METSSQRAGWALAYERTVQAPTSRSAKPSAITADERLWHAESSCAFMRSAGGLQCDPPARAPLEFLDLNGPLTAAAVACKIRRTGSFRRAGRGRTLRRGGGSPLADLQNDIRQIDARPVDVVLYILFGLALHAVRSASSSTASNAIAGFLKHVAAARYSHDENDRR